ILAIIVVLLLSIAYLTYAERKVLAAIQLRQGPSLTGPFGLLQPIADGLKLLFKETIIPTASNRWLFLFAPILTFSLSLAAW
ncbi:NADH-quinone oxidoreductase subunit H, partial [Acinetobacter baumannii]